jgi:hypothetical protein
VQVTCQVRTRVEVPQHSFIRSTKWFCAVSTCCAYYGFSPRLAVTSPLPFSSPSFRAHFISLSQSVHKIKIFLYPKPLLNTRRLIQQDIK